MVVRTARASPFAIGGAALALAGLIATGLSAAEEEVLPPPLSAACQAFGADTTTPVSLPELAAALEAQKTITVLTLGSLSTLGTGASSSAKSYPVQLEAILEKTFKGLDVIVVNRGVSGELAAITAARIKVEVALVKPNLVLWQVGTNDALAHVPVDEFTTTVRDTLRWLKAHKIDVVLVGLQSALRSPSDEPFTAIRLALRELATSENVPLIRRLETMQFIQQAKGEPDDGLRPADGGPHCMAEHIARAVVAGAFLRRKRPGDPLK